MHDIHKAFVYMLNQPNPGYIDVHSGKNKTFEYPEPECLVWLIGREIDIFYVVSADSI